MKIQYSVYSLVKKNKVNAKDSSSTREGVLLKVIDQEFWGVADLATWPELGDLTWQEELKTKGALFQRALNLAKEDLAARKENRSLLKDQTVTNNILITDYKNTDTKNPQFIGQTLKIKGDADIQSLARFIHALPVTAKLRIDFNNSLDSESFESFLGKIFLAVDRIEYIEDPVAYEIELWSGWNQMIPLAWDFQTVSPAPHSYSYRIVKPTRTEIPVKVDYTLTSDMSHPVGLAHGLRIAQNFALNPSGFLTLDLFEETAFHKYFVKTENQLNFSVAALKDTGIGMAEELNHLDWLDYV
ncbi:MAG: hypothetical protein H7328_12885 [Bdellovibrio sp.]|nr:hypothetical protein [Bdellovibrio sp.]